MRSKADEYEKIIEDMIKLNKQFVDIIFSGFYGISSAELKELKDSFDNLKDLYEYKKAKKD